LLPSVHGGDPIRNQVSAQSLRGGRVGGQLAERIQKACHAAQPVQQVGGGARDDRELERRLQRPQEVPDLRLFVDVLVVFSHHNPRSRNHRSATDNREGSPLFILAGIHMLSLASPTPAPTEEAH
jgi:hypothetical protein